MDGLNNNYRRVRRITIVNKSIILSNKDKQELAKYAESEAYPSETDKKFMRVNPFPWIIYSGKTNEMNCFILEDENVKQISII